MSELMQEYWLLILVALVIGFIVAWWVFHAARRTHVELEDKADGDGAAKRNQALIDAPPVAGAVPGTMSAAANADAVAAAPAAADAEAGAAVPAREAMHKMADVSPGESAEALAPEPTDAPSPAPSQGDDLRRIKGVGPKLVTLLAEQGVTNFAQIAAWTDADIDRIDANLGRFQGRIRRDDWVAQAQMLAADDISGYEERFGKI
ncbi:hypothetical protein [Erythrobacter alti]|uniref:hypothetical protein n=1 Tax=Erythrobacter alti TaxID=1896145 RepID=UPI0030F3A4EF